MVGGPPRAHLTGPQLVYYSSRTFPISFYSHIIQSHPADYEVFHVLRFAIIFTWNIQRVQ